MANSLDDLFEEAPDEIYTVDDLQQYVELLQNG